MRAPHDHVIRSTQAAASKAKQYSQRCRSPRCKDIICLLGRQMRPGRDELQEDEAQEI
jgi:hypothetical protein